MMALFPRWREEARPVRIARHEALVELRAHLIVPLRDRGPEACDDPFSIRAKLFGLPAETVVKTGHGEDTTIGAEKEALGT